MTLTERAEQLLAEATRCHELGITVPARPLEDMVCELMRENEWLRTRDNLASAIITGGGYTQ